MTSSGRPVGQGSLRAFGRTLGGLALAAVAMGGAASCSRPDPLGVMAAQLRACDFKDGCAVLVAKARGLDGEARTSAGGREARLAALRVELDAVAAFPGPKAAFLQQAGLAPADAPAVVAKDAADLAAEARAPDEAEDAVTLAGFLVGHTCEGFQKVEDVRTAGGRLAQTAALVRLSTLAQIFAASEADSSQMFAEVARAAVGCTRSDRMSGAALLVDTRNLMMDLLDACPRGDGDAVLKETCEVVRGGVASKPLALPLPDATSGDLFGALPPVAGRRVAMAFTPPWVLVLAGGRLSIVDQAVAAPGVRQVPEARTTPMIDLRTPHGPDEVYARVNLELKDRKPRGTPPLSQVAIVADRNATASDLLEVIKAVQSELPNATPLVAVLMPPSRSVQWYPVNFFYPQRAALDPQGSLEGGFGSPADAVRVHLSAFDVRFQRGALSRTAEIVRMPGDAGGWPYDLRDVYRAAMDFVPDQGGPVPTLLTMEPAVSVGLLLPVLETLAFKVPPVNLANPGAFASSTPAQKAGGRIALALSRVIVQPAPQ